MVAQSPASRVRAATFLVLAVASAGLRAQPVLTLEQAGSRKGPDFTPVYENIEVIVRGTVSHRLVPATSAYLLPIQDATAHGLLLRGSEAQLSSFEPGDLIEAEGVIRARAGTPVLAPARVTHLRPGKPPQPLHLSLADLDSPRYFGVLVTTETVVSQVGENRGGVILSLGEGRRQISAFLARHRRDSAGELDLIHASDVVRVTGIASQYCLLPPYDRFYQILVPERSDLVLLNRRWHIAPTVLFLGLLILFALGSAGYALHRRMVNLRRRMRVLHTLAEEITAAESPAEIDRELRSALPSIWKATKIRVYLLDAGSGQLQALDREPPSARASLDLDEPVGPIAAAAALCIRNRTLLAIPDTRKSPVFRADPGTDTPRSVMFVPMLARDEALGVLLIEHTQLLHQFTSEEQSAMQHVANQVAMALKLQEQRSMREQLFRSEKLAAAGQLMSGIANELRAPIECIVDSASAMARTEAMRPDHRHIQILVNEARRASEIVSRLVSFGKTDRSEIGTVDLDALLAEIVRFREGECRARGIELTHRQAGKVLVLGSACQIEEVLLNLLLQAERSALEARERSVTLSACALSRRAHVEITFGLRTADNTAAVNSLSLEQGVGMEVCRSLLETLGGELRCERLSATHGRFTIEVPALAELAGGAELAMPGIAPRSLTILIVDPDREARHALMTMLSARKHRVVPVASPHEGLELMERLRFDSVFCNARLREVPWIELFQRAVAQKCRFVLLTEGYDGNFSRAVQAGDGFVLRKPFGEEQLAGVLLAIQTRPEDAVVQKSR